MRNKAGILALSSVLALSLVVSACSSNNTNESSSSNKSNSQSGTSNTGTTPANESTNPEDLYLGKYEPAIDVSTVRILSSTVKFPEDQTIDKNLYYDEYTKKLGINLKNEWTVTGDEPGGQGEQKMNVSIASGDLPDIVPLNASQLRSLADAGKLADLTEIYEKYASPLTKQVLTSSGTTALDSAKFDGKLLAIPATTSSVDLAPLVWIRTDWLKKLNLQPAKTMDDVFNIMDAFVNQDPDGNGKKDTYGMAMNKDLYGFFGGLEGFFDSYHAYARQDGKGNWVKDADGNLVFGSIQPEVKNALGKLQELYKKGYIDPEFGVKSWDKEKELVVAGKIGLHFSTMSTPLIIQDIKKNDPNADWQAFPLVSVDDQPAKPQVPAISLKTPQYFAVTKDFKNPEALIKMINLFMEITYGTSYTKEENKQLNGYKDYESWMWGIYSAEPEKNLNTHRLIKEIVNGSKKESDLMTEQTFAYERSRDYLAGKREVLDWAFYRIFGPEESAFSVVDGYVNNNLLMRNGFDQIMTDTMVKRDSTLLKLELETFTKIILGDSLDSFDTFVKNWKKLGGDEMTKEVNELVKSK
ncbi:extracellular solute-binding protein [Paenibacillus algorifonticola]|uniref:extracellular solute-binding protein n=1 Tax=Paenibacillus algorifonticola TaxID=684063 RepID=UPI003D29502B